MFCGMADPTTGLRRIPALGNAQKRLSWRVKGLGPGAYYWSVQAVDTAFAGSPWAEEQQLRVIAFNDIGAGLTGVQYCSLAWGDYDNDGDLDLALAGRTDVGAPVSRVYRNDGGAFTDIGAGLTGVDYLSLIHI